MAQRNNFESTPENRARVAKIVEYLSAQKDGETITWLDIEQHTGIPCRPVGEMRPGDIDGRALTRTALRHMKREVETIRGTGFRLSSADNAMTLVADKVHSLFRKGTRVKKCGQNIMQRHGEQLSPGARDRLTRTNALLATLTMQAGESRKLLK